MNLSSEKIFYHKFHLQGGIDFQYKEKFYYADCFVEFKLLKKNAISINPKSIQEYLHYDQKSTLNNKFEFAQETTYQKCTIIRFLVEQLEKNKFKVDII